MAIWYQATEWINNVRPVKIVKETEKFVYFENGQRFGKNSDGQWFRPTHEEAKQCLVDARQRDVDNLQRSLVDASTRLEEAKKA